MSRLTSEQQRHMTHPAGGEGVWRGGSERSEGRSNGLLLAGLAVVGLGALAVYYFGPDLRRYLKIKNM